MMTDQSTKHDESPWPHATGGPAKGALAAAGYTRLEQLAEVSEAELLKLHGMGPKALAVLRETLASRGLRFAEAWPAGVSQPAQRALAAAGYTRLEQLANVREADLARLHGMGPKALDILRGALEQRGLSFAPPEPE